MGDKISIMCKPILLLDSMIKERAIKDFSDEKDLNEEELKKLVDSEGLDKNIVLKISFEQHNLLNIGNVWKFPLVTKLQLSDNFIEEIECLEFLVNLQFLDLSFNAIKLIKGFNDLICLKFLNLSFNKIEILQNMESLKKLETFLVRYNNLKSFDNINYLTQFKNLISLGIQGNPLKDLSDVRLHIISVLPHLKLLDFEEVAENEVQISCEKFQNRVVNCNDVVSPRTNIFERDPECINSFSKKHVSDQEAFIDGLTSGRGLEKLLEYDRNFYLLYSYPPVAKYTDYHRKKVTEAFDDWHQYGFKYYQQMEKEKEEFLKMIKEAHVFVLNIVKEEEYEFINFKENIPKELCLIIQKYTSSLEMDNKIMELKAKWEARLLNTYRNFMNASSCLLIDLIQKLSKVFKQEMLIIKAKYLNDVEASYKIIVEHNDVCISKLMTYYSDMFDNGTTPNIEGAEGNSQCPKLDPDLLQIVKI
ncbi:dynein regulatory complex subunit 3 isoform X2 [Parasteatoda tepidariorum]|uniref:dynein regulatory complex subunit 3 isoform X2 n=1 Tax=Parasteatoda tepidariorum TaxID=114398 RepID=UPI0039BD2A4A